LTVQKPIRQKQRFSPATAADVTDKRQSFKHLVKVVEWRSGNLVTARNMRVSRIILGVAAGLVVASAALYTWHQYVQAELLKPNVFSTANQTRWLFDSGYRYDFDEHESLVIGNWITTHQTGWKFGSSNDFDPRKTQLLSDNYVISIDSNVIVFQYYKSQADLANDPSNGFIVIKRSLSPDEQSFWKEQVSQIGKSNHGVRYYR
jgi:hypothetical protein